MTTGERMKDRRKALGLSAEQVAESLGVSPATIYRYEKGDIEKVPGPYLATLASILHTTAPFLMGWTDDPYGVASPSDPQLETLQRSFSQLNGEGREKLVDYATDLVASGRYIKNHPSVLGQKTS